MSKTISATVKVMQSYNYCHFEASKVIEANEGSELTMQEIDTARIDCQMLTDKAVEQYKKAKTHEQKRAGIQNEYESLMREVGEIKKKSENEWSPVDKAKVKALEDQQYQQRHYDYFRDEEDYGF
jgi:hypothetical protein